MGKLQWNHVVSDKQSFSLRIAENYNSYVFDQPVSDLNLASVENANPPVSGTDCPAYPYAPGSPVVDGASGLCTADLGDYYQNRTSHMYFASLDYTATPNQNLTLNFGAGQEYDVNYRNVYNLVGFGADGSYPQYNALSDFPTHIPFAYVQASINTGRFTLEPGLRWSRIWYGLSKSVSPGGSISTGAFNPTFAGTYRANPANVVRFSYGATQSFIGSEFVFRARDDGGANTYDPSRGGFSYQPQLNHNADLMLEHTFGPGTSLRFGPWYRHSTGYLQLYRPVIGTNADGTPKYASSSQAIPSNGGENRAFGFELGFTHEDRRPAGASLYFAATYDNLWTTSVSQVSFSNTPLPPEFTDIGDPGAQPVRAADRGQRERRRAQRTVALPAAGRVRRRHLLQHRPVPQRDQRQRHARVHELLLGGAPARAGADVHRQSVLGRERHPAARAGQADRRAARHQPVQPLERGGAVLRLHQQRLRGHRRAGLGGEHHPGLVHLPGRFAEPAPLGGLRDHALLMRARCAV